MAQTGYTPISLYYSTTASAAPTAGNLVAGELALNTLDEKLYFKNSAGVVKLLASNSASTGTVSSVAMSVPTFLSVTGSPITTSGTLAVTYSGTALPVVNGGTGQTSYTDGQLLIGNSTGNTLTKATLTAGTNISITNAAGAITINGTSAGGSLSLVANSALSAGDLAVIRSDGQVEPANASFERSAPGYSPGVTIDFQPFLVAIDSTRFALVDNSASVLRIVIGTISGGAITYGTAYTLSSVPSVFAVAYNPVTTKLLVYWLSGGSTPTFNSYTISGSTITLSGSLTMNTGTRPASSSRVGLAYDAAATSIVMLFPDANNSNFATAILVNTTAASPTLTATSTTVVSSVSANLGAYCTLSVSGTRVLFCYALSSSTAAFNGGTWNGTTYTLGTATASFAAYFNYGLVYCQNNQFAWTYTSNATTQVRVYSITLSSNTPTLNLNEIISTNTYNTSIGPSSYGRTFYDAVGGVVCNLNNDYISTRGQNTYLTRVAIDSSGVLTLNTPITYSSSPVYVAPANLFGTGVYMSGPAKTVFINTLISIPTKYNHRFINASLTPNGPSWVGISSASYAPAATAVITSIGATSTTLSGLTTATRYYADVNGQPIPDSQAGVNGNFGTALSSTSMYIRG